MQLWEVVGCVGALGSVVVVLHRTVGDALQYFMSIGHKLCKVWSLEVCI